MPAPGLSLSPCLASGSRVVVGMSGGVDSAVAALLLLRQGYEVEGLFMHNWDDDDVHCTASRDFQDARSVAHELGIPLHRVDFSAQYRDSVFRQFLDDYRSGRTPNPDVLCNREIKFGVCLQHARRLGAAAFATGHYAGLAQEADGIALRKAQDCDKDQTYFLHAVRREELTSVLFPLAQLMKSQVRDMARVAGLPVFAKPDSTGICFIGERPFREFLARHLHATPGPIEDDRGHPRGRHRGLPFYTLGQRGGLEIGGQPDALAAPWYVARKDVTHNRLIVVQGHEHGMLQSVAIRTATMHWLCAPPEQAFDAAVKVRYRQADQPARILPLPGGGVSIELRSPLRAVTPGQSAVIYRGSRCLGGGVIEATL